MSMYGKNHDNIVFSLQLKKKKKKDLPTMQKIWVWSLGWEDPPEEGIATQYSCLENPHTEESGG